MRWIKKTDGKENGSPYSFDSDFINLMQNRGFPIYQID